MRYSTCAACFLLMLATGANAQELTYGQLYAGTSNLEVEGEGDIDVEFFGGGAEFVVNSFTFSLDAARISTEIGDVDVAAAAAEYQFDVGLSVGVEHARAEFEDLDTSINSLFAVYEAGSYAIGVSVGDSDDLEDNVIGVFGSWDISANTKLGFEHLSLDDVDLNAAYSDFQGERSEFYFAYAEIEDIDVLVLATSFDVYGNLGLSGGYSRFYDDFGDLEIYSVGAQYGITDQLDIGASLGRIALEGASDDIDVVSFGIEYEVGRRTSSRSRSSDLLGRIGGAQAGSFGF